MYCPEASRLALLRSISKSREWCHVVLMTSWWLTATVRRLPSPELWRGQQSALRTETLLFDRAGPLVCAGDTFSRLLSTKEILQRGHQSGTGNGRFKDHNVLRALTAVLIRPVVWAIVVQLCCSIGASSLARAAKAFPSTGSPVAGLSSLDAAMPDLLQRWSIPGASVAIARKGKLVYSRGFGWADKEHWQPVKPNSMFRIASISKSITAVAALKLVEQGRLKLTDKAFEILSDYTPCSGAVTDKRIYDVTVRDLLQCTAGWEGKHGEPLFGEELLKAATACSVTPPPDLKTIIKYWMQKPLAFEPGSRYGYSNFAYSILGEIIAKTANRTYVDFVQEEVLRPIGMSRTMPGRTVETLPGETRYYPAPGDQQSPSLLSCDGKLAPWAYGGDFITELITAPAGWISSAPDLVRLASTLAGQRSGRPISELTVQTMLTQPSVATWKGKKGYFSMGWEVYETDSGKMFSRIGGMSGTVAYVVYRPDGTCWSVVFNCRSVNQTALMDETKKLLWQSIKDCRQWPLVDRFASCPAD